MAITVFVSSGVSVVKHIFFSSLFVFEGIVFEFPEFLLCEIVLLRFIVFVSYVFKHRNFWDVIILTELRFVTSKNDLFLFRFFANN